MDSKSRRNFFTASAKIGALVGTAGLATKLFSSASHASAEAGLKAARIFRAGVHKELLNRDFLLVSLQKFADEIFEKSAGSIEIKVDHQIHTRPAQYVLHRNELDFLITSPALHGSGCAAQLFLGAGPIKFTPLQQMAFLSRPEVQKLWNEIYGFYGLSSVFYGVAASEFSQFSRSELLNKIELSKLTVPNSDWRSNWYTQLGARSVKTASLDSMMKQFASKTVDLTDPLPNAINQRFASGMGESFYIANPYWRSSPAFELVSRSQSWSSFSSDEKALITSSAAARGREIFEFHEHAERKARASLLSSSSQIKAVNLSANVCEYMLDCQALLLNAISKSDAVTLQMTEHYKNFLETV